MSQRLLELLLIEDNYPDVRWLQLLLGEIQFPHMMYVVRDGEQALAFLGKTGEYASAPDPDLIMVDLDLPRISGADVVTAIRSDERLRHIPTCVLSGSPAEHMATVLKYELDVRCYMVKPITREAFTDALNSYDQLKPFLNAWRGTAAGENL